MRGEGGGCLSISSYLRSLVDAQFIAKASAVALVNRQRSRHITSFGSHGQWRVHASIFWTTATEWNTPGRTTTTETEVTLPRSGGGRVGWHLVSVTVSDALRRSADCSSGGFVSLPTLLQLLSPIRVKPRLNRSVRCCGMSSSARPGSEDGGPAGQRERVGFPSGWQKAMTWVGGRDRHSGRRRAECDEKRGSQRH